MPSLREEVRARIEVVEESYEYLLAYAAQGLTSDRGSKSGGQLRDRLGRCAVALDRLGDQVGALVTEEGLEPVDAWDGFVEVLTRDAEAAHAAVRLVASRDAISSQLVDNLNANVHLRALLTDLFLLDDLLGP